MAKTFSLYPYVPVPVALSRLSGARHIPRSCPWSSDLNQDRTPGAGLLTPAGQLVVSLSGLERPVPKKLSLLYFHSLPLVNRVQRIF